MSESTLRTGAELRRAFLDFFVRQGHTEVPSSLLVPIGDPTLLFTTAGMVQFKPYYLADDVPYTRATSVQKCLRTGDLDNVGLTPRHDTFFEMLGNFSFGPRAKGAYFKEEAIAFAWDFVTHVLALPKDRLYASIFEGEGTLPRDDEAIALWKKVGIPESRIVPLGRKDNFWGPAGGAGACGPCSEIYFDLGEKRPEYLPEGAFWGEAPGDPGDRYMEFWNLVFPQFDAQADGTLSPLRNPGIDTGMGIERLALIVQGKSSIFETDLFAPLVDEVLAGAKVAPANRMAATRDARIIADHVRGLTFAIAEGVVPGNEGAGYVLRRLLRRAVTRGRSRQSLTITDAFLPRVADRAIAAFGVHYRELVQHRDRVLRVLENEETGFGQTYVAGMARLDDILVEGAVLSGEEAFELHDTYGFPIELAEEVASYRGARVDRAGFDTAMEIQRNRARAASKFTAGGVQSAVPWTVISTGQDSQFTGYSTEVESGIHIMRWRGSPDALELVLDKTPFYPESGGQVSDAGHIVGVAKATPVGFELLHARREGGSIVHFGKMDKGSLGELLAASSRSDLAAGALYAGVDSARRRAASLHHTATHMLHALLRQKLGSHVHQAGSLVAPEKLRFDYTHFEAPTEEQLGWIIGHMFMWINANERVDISEMDLESAKASGAMALFGEKYTGRVRVVSIPGKNMVLPESRELCGGTHAGTTGELIRFHLLSESAVASGIRRIEAICGPAVIARLEAREAMLQEIADDLQVAPEAVRSQVQRLQSEADALRADIVRLASEQVEQELDAAIDSAHASDSGRWFVLELRTALSPDSLRGAADRTMKVLGAGAFVVASRSGGKLTFMAAVSSDLVEKGRLRADELVREVAKVTGGSGGGKPHLALAGGKDAAKLGAALDEARRRLREALGA